MSLIFLGLVVLLLLINLAGAGLLLRRWLPYYPIAKVAGALGFCLVMFFVEHVIGLGRLTWLWPIATGVSLAAIYVWRDDFRAGLWREEWVFVAAFGVALLWKFSFPDIDAHSEQLTDLAFITSYLSGDTLPPVDYWLPDRRLDMYYAFQHYCAALMGRVLGLSPGYSMNLAIVIVLAMLASLAWFVASRYCRPRWPRVVLLVVLMAGGTGIAPLTHILFDQHKPGNDRAFTAVNNMWANVRFAGMYDDGIDTDLGRKLFPKPSPQSPPGPDSETRDLPLETIGYLTMLGDFHPPLGGFVLLFLALACVVALETSALPDNRLFGSRDVSARVVQALLAATVPLALITNSWVFPLQAVFLLAWLGYRYARNSPPDWVAVTLGGAVTLALAYPFISHFALQALETHFRWVTVPDHTPPDRFVALHWPELALLALALTQVRRRPLLLWLVVLFAGLLLLSELVYVDDPMDGKYNRFNSALKWWSWIYPAMLLGLGSMLLGAGRWQRYVTVLVLLPVAVFSWDMANYWYYSDKTAMGKLSGDHWLRGDAANKQMLEWLRAAPRGVVLEGYDDGGAYTPASALALFAGQPSASGWPDHESQWRGNLTFIGSNAEKNRLFFHGKLAQPVSWLAASQIDYVVWTRRDQERDGAARRLIHAQISAAYDWKPFWQNGDEELGVWIRKQNVGSGGTAARVPEPSS